MMAMVMDKMALCAANAALEGQFHLNLTVSGMGHFRTD
jgi:hypothetical protein